MIQLNQSKNFYVSFIKVLKINESKNNYDSSCFNVSHLIIMYKA